MKFLDPNDPFFRHAWVRWVSVLVPVGWGLMEFLWLGSPFWGILFLGAGGYAGYMLFFKRTGD